jgi:hypothetical protein
MLVIVGDEGIGDWFVFRFCMLRCSLPPAHGSPSVESNALLDISLDPAALAPRPAPSRSSRPPGHTGPAPGRTPGDDPITPLRRPGRPPTDSAAYSGPARSASPSPWRYGKIIEMTIDPQRSAVLALHWQVNVIKPEGFFGPMLSAPVARSGVVERAVRFHRSVREAGVTVVFTRFTVPVGEGGLVRNTELMRAVGAGSIPCS